MSIALSIAPAMFVALPRLLGRIAVTMLTVMLLAQVAGFVALMRTFAFEYFHGDHTAMAGLVHALLGN